jgi:hypothetical protein
MVLLANDGLFTADFKFGAYFVNSALQDHPESILPILQQIPNHDHGQGGRPQGQLNAVACQVTIHSTFNLINSQTTPLQVPQR